MVASDTPDSPPLHHVTLSRAGPGGQSRPALALGGAAPAAPREPISRRRGQPHSRRGTSDTGERPVRGGVPEGSPATTVARAESPRRRGRPDDHAGAPS